MLCEKILNCSGALDWRIKFMSNEVILGLIRHLLTTAGGVLVTKGYADSSMVETGVAALVTLFGVGWSIVHKGQVKTQINNAALTGNS